MAAVAHTVDDAARPIPTPCRALPAIARPVSSDAQPAEQQAWEAAFPTAGYEDTLVDKVDENGDYSGLGHATDAAGSDDELLDPAARQHYTPSTLQSPSKSFCDTV